MLIAKAIHSLTETSERLGEKTTENCFGHAP